MNKQQNKDVKLTCKFPCVFLCELQSMDCDYGVQVSLLNCVETLKIVIGWNYRKQLIG